MAHGACANCRRQYSGCAAAGDSPVRERRQGSGCFDWTCAAAKAEGEISGRPPDERKRAPQAHTRSALDDLKVLLGTTLAQLSAKSPLAMGYSLSNWTALMRFVDDGRIQAHNNAADRVLRDVAIGRKNYLHLGSDAGCSSAAVIYTLIGSAKLNGIDPQAYQRHVLDRIADHPSNRIDELLPWAVAGELVKATPKTLATADKLVA